MKVAIHNCPGSFSDRWIVYCKEKDIAYKIVNCYDNDIIRQVEECDILLWHYHHASFKDSLLAKQLLFSLEHSGLKVFPNFNTAWHFDDKIGQKYLLESIGAPLVPSFVFYNKNEALEWVEEVSFPKIFKLRGGAGSANVSLVETKREAIKLINRAFGKGFEQFNRLQYFKEGLRKFKDGRITFIGLIKAFGRLFITTEFSKLKGKENGYVYFQEFIPGNNSDIRVIVIGDRAFAIQRYVRKNDFRASGSGNIVFLDPSSIDRRCLQIAFETSNKLSAQCLAYDFVFTKAYNPVIIEISFGFSMEAYDGCKGYWNKNLDWFEGKFNPQEWMVDLLIR